jgi:hypothetical protein
MDHFGAITKMVVKRSERDEDRKTSVEGADHFAMAFLPLPPAPEVRK